MIEEWRAIPGTGRMYWASDQGRIFRVGYVATTPRGNLRIFPSRILKTFDNQGYRRFVLNSRQKMMVHRAVAFAFLPVAHTTETVNHLDGDKTNNRPSNLEWCTHVENVKHAWREGLSKAQPNTVNRTAPEKEAKVCALVSEGVLTLSAISRATGVPRTTAWAIRERMREAAAKKFKCRCHQPPDECAC